MEVDEKLRNGTEESDNSSEDELTEGGMDVTCLFCIEKSATVEDSIKHCALTHSFDIHTLRDKCKLDYYSYIKLINYIRSKKPDPNQLSNCDQNIWADEEYLKPYDINDPWLWHDLEGLRGFVLEDDKPSNYVNSENGNVTMSQEHFSELLATIQGLTEEIRRKAEQVSKFQKILGDEIQFSERTASHLRDNDDSSYFWSYNSAHIQWEMLSDNVRTISYKDAIMNNSSLFTHKRVLDIGCGTGILSMIAASAGAEKVVAVDNSEILYNALDIARENNLHNKIIFIKGRIEDCCLPFEKYDIIVSEWMGYFLLYEAMIDSVIYARNKFLKPNGIMLPSICNMYLIGASNTEHHNSTLGFWNNVHGYKMTSMIPIAINEAAVELIDDKHIATTPFKLHTIDINKCCVEDTLFTTQFTLIATKDTSLTHLVGYFDVEFHLPIQVKFTTSPSGPPTHWKQTVFLLENPIILKQGNKLTGILTCSRLERSVRSIKVEIEIDAAKYLYYLN